MPDQIESFLEGFGRHQTKAPAPPAAFLAAVWRRRRQRRLAQTAAVAVVLVVVGAGGLLLRQVTRPVLSGPDRVLAVAQPAPASLAGLLHLNPDLAAETLRLPQGALIEPDQPIQVGMRWEPAQIEQWITR